MKILNVTVITLPAEFSEFDDSDADKTYFPEDISEEKSYGIVISTRKSTEEGNFEESERGKKRRRKPELHKRMQRKKLRNSGKAYIGHRNIPKQEKKFVYFEHSCRYKCCNDISVEEALNIFTHFWELGSWDLQTAFISSCIKIQEPLRKKVKATFHRKKSVTILLKNRRVCKNFFLKTLKISNGRFSRVVNKKTDLGFIGSDLRGKHSNPKKIPNEDRELVNQHINLFPKYRSHYTRKENIDRKFLPSYLTIKKMYECYKEFCTEKQKKPVKEWLYREIFNTSFNLSFHQPHTDTCNKCDNFANLLKAVKDEDERRALEIQKELHQRKAEKAIEQKKEARKLAQESDNELVAICFDLQKTLPTPSLTTNKVYYLRTLWTYNFGIHDLGNNKAYMYTWDESTASRGSSEVASCLLKFIKQLPRCTKRIVAFSDSCGGQNKNKNILKFWMYISKFTDIEIIDHKFLEPGHTYMECDEDFALIEKHKRHVPYIFIPDDWTRAIKETSKKFVVETMKAQDFFFIF